MRQYSAVPLGHGNKFLLTVHISCTGRRVVPYLLDHTYFCYQLNCDRRRHKTDGGVDSIVEKYKEAISQDKKLR